MEQLILQYPALIWITWAFLNFLHYYLNFLNSRIYKNLADFDFKFELEYNKKSFLRLLVWIGFGIAFLSAYRQAFLAKVVTTEEYFAWIGGFFFLIVGYLLRDVQFLGGYFIYRRETTKKITYSFKTSMILASFEFFGYSAITLLCFLVSKNSFLFGGTIGLAFAGILFIFEIKRKKNSPKIEAIESR